MDQLFTWETLATLGGLTIATAVITNVVRQVAGLNAKWVGLLVAFVLSLLVWWFAGGRQVSDLALAIVNAFLVYAAAGADLNDIINGLQPKTSRSADNARIRGVFWRPWW